MTTEQTVDKIIDAYVAHKQNNIGANTFLVRIGDAVNDVVNKAEEEARKEERAFILNVLDGIDIADGECNTKAIRECLKARAV